MSFQPSDIERCILLRRPPTVQLVDGPFVPDDADLDEIDQRWSAMCDANPYYFDGRLCNVLGVHRNGAGGATIHIADCAYRFHAVQDETFDLGVRSLGVKALTKRDGKYLIGRRSENVGTYSGAWEFAPGGAVEPDRDPAAVIASELEEETALRTRGEPIAAAIITDPVVLTWELVYRIDDPVGEVRCSPEYDELKWASPHELPGDCTAIARAIRSRLLAG